jgi:hypothetical protein
MKILSTALLLLFALTSCVAPRKSFSQMSAAEIMAYNRTVEYRDQIYCERKTYAGSHIPRNECRTLLQIAEGSPGSLNTPSSSQSILQPQ